MPDPITQPRILIVEPLGDEGLALLQSHAAADVRLGLSPQELASTLAAYHALIVRSGTRVDAALLEAGTNLVVVGRAGVGVDNIDVPAATRHGITVVNAPTTNIVSAAEHALALLWSLARHIPSADASVRRGEWKREAFTGLELVGKQLGLVGLGRVGGEVARRAIGLGLSVVAYDPFVAPDRAALAQVRLVSLPELLSSSDFISLHAPVTRDTRQLIGAPELAQVKPGALLVNAARGALLDTSALLDALDRGQLAGAALDVYDPEPPKDSRLLSHPRVVLTPHIGGSTVESAARVSKEIAQEVLAVLEGRPARFAVNAPLVPPALAQVVGPYLELAECLGRFYTLLVDGPLGPLQVEYAGDLAAHDTGLLTAAVIKGLLEPVHDTRVNLVNARLAALEHGLHLSERRTPESGRYESVITLSGTRRLAGALLNGEPHIVELDGRWVDLVPRGHVMLTRHRDRPGMIGKVGTLLGRADINIASMQVARDGPRGDAIMVLQLDDPVPPAVLDALRRELDIQSAQVLDLQ